MPKELKTKLLKIVDDLSKRVGIFQNKKFPFKTATRKKLLEYIKMYRILQAYKRFHGQDTNTKWSSTIKKLQKNDPKSLPITITTLEALKQSDLSKFLLEFFRSIDVFTDHNKKSTKQLKKLIISKKYSEILYNRSFVSEQPKVDQ